MISYILQVIFCQSLFLVVYSVLFRDNTFFTINRFYLLFACLISLIIPFVRIDFLATNTSSNSIFFGLSSAMIFLEGIEVSASGRTANGSDFFWVSWVVGAGMMLLLFLRKLFILYRLSNVGARSKYKGYTIILLPESEAAFSFFKWIFLGDAHKENGRQAILFHERVHIRQWHSLDLMFMEFLKIIFWFNPLIWVYQRQIAAVHEYLADASAAGHGKTEYYNQLLSQVFGVPNLALVNPFFKKSLIKKRIVMLHKQRSPHQKKKAYILILPILAGMLWISSCQREPSNRIDQDSLIEVPFAAVDQVPVFPGCEDAQDKRSCFNEKIQRHIMKNFRYPQEAQDNGIEGRVNVVFTIDLEGNISGIEKRGPDPILENEVERIIMRLPKMQPGRQDGKPVNVPFSIPVVFKLE